MTYSNDIKTKQRLLARPDTTPELAAIYREDIAELERKQAEEIAGPQVGDGVTACFYTDRHAMTVIKRTPKTVTVQRDRVTRKDGNGMSDCQDYDYAPNPDGATAVFSLRANGTWRKRGESDTGTRLVAGRREYYDYSF